jgi:hypothetical protein
VSEGASLSRREEERGDVTFVPEFVGIAGGAHDGELGRGKEIASCCFGGHLSDAVMRCIRGVDGVLHLYMVV